jgi:glucose-6-phosphate dehydrogenase assembly protein OpcA
MRFRAEQERAVAARVFAQCWMPFGHRQQICCEQIEINASDASLPDLPPVVLPLAVPDLPVILWCRSPRLFHLDTFPLLAAMSQKLVLDSAAFPEPAATLRELGTMVAAGRALADLSWTRLTRWRELISQIFENRVQLADLPRVSDVVISYRGATAPAPAIYMAAWLIDGLAAVGVQSRARFASVEGEPDGRIQRVDLLAQDGGEAIASIALVEGQAAEVRSGKLVNRAPLPPLTDYSLMREELSIPGRDPVFERTLARAVTLL